MNVREFTGDAANTNQQAVWKAMGPFSGVIILGLLGGKLHIVRFVAADAVVVVVVVVIVVAIAMR